ncbi:VanZ family protein [Allorhodopirellula solitaria]|uniref:VanZ like family protein n=1 Tax=Allorhodopirellula solitaria TaxID=2527987 RepID=A0A5C5X0T0_9BACT|nr:VanZ family protein [Allorhodopirellula solitaria]TWT56556.1 VanZ like family protein [Allorhodopirellula solitaria]
MQSVSGVRLFGFRLGILILVVYWCAIFTGTHLPVIPGGMPRINDKVLHFTAFFILATLLCYCTTSKRVWPRVGWIIATCLIYGVVDELTQALVRGRTPDVKDFFADALGTLAAVSLYFGIRAVWRSWRRATRRRRATAPNRSLS